MHCTVNSRDLTRALKILMTIAGRGKVSASVPVLANILIDARLDPQGVSLTATNLDVGIQCLLPAEVAMSGTITLPVKQLAAAVGGKTASPVVIKSLENRWVEITNGHSTSKLAGIPADEFPQAPQPPTSMSMITIPGETMLDFARRTVVVATSAKEKCYLEGVKFEITPQYARMVSTDWHRLAYVNHAWPLDDARTALDTIISLDALKLIARLLHKGDMTIGVNAPHVYARIGSWLVTARIPDGTFPDYARVMPDNPIHITVMREEFIGAIEHVLPHANAASRAVKLTFTTGLLELYTSNDDGGEARTSLATDYDGLELAVGFDGKYLLDFLKSTSALAVLLELKDSAGVRPCRQFAAPTYHAMLMRPVGDPPDTDHRYVVMPMHL